jgi:hypothetical protein
MKKKYFSAIILLALFAQCSKDKNEKPGPDLEKNLLAFFQLDDNFDDSTKNIQDAQYGGSLTSVKDRHGYADRAISFNGNGGSFSFEADEWPANPITVSLWVKPKDLDINNFLIISHTGAFGVAQSKSKFGLVISTPGTESALADIDTGWTHFAGTYDGKDIKTYIDGKLAKTFHHPGTPDATSTITVGATGLPEWQGVIDDLRFYGRVLSPEEIKLLSEL